MKKSKHQTCIDCERLFINIHNTGYVHERPRARSKIGLRTLGYTKKKSSRSKWTDNKTARSTPDLGKGLDATPGPRARCLWNIFIMKKGLGIVPAVAFQRHSLFVFSETDDLLVAPPEAQGSRIHAGDFHELVQQISTLQVQFS